MRGDRRRDPPLLPEDEGRAVEADVAEEAVQKVPGAEFGGPGSE